MEAGYMAFIMAWRMHVSEEGIEKNDSVGTCQPVTMAKSIGACTSAVHAPWKHGFGLLPHTLLNLATCYVQSQETDAEMRTI